MKNKEQLRKYAETAETLEQRVDKLEELLESQHTLLLGIAKTLSFHDEVLTSLLVVLRDAN